MLVKHGGVIIHNLEWLTTNWGEMGPVPEPENENGHQNQLWMSLLTNSYLSASTQEIGDKDIIRKRAHVNAMFSFLNSPWHLKVDCQKRALVEWSAQEVRTDSLIAQGKIQLQNIYFKYEC